MKEKIFKKGIHTRLFSVVLALAMVLSSLIISTTPAFASDAPVPLTFTALEDSSIKFKAVQFSDVQYNKNGSGWASYTSEEVIGLAAGDYVQFKANKNAYFPNDSSYSQFTMGTGKIEASGDVTSLYNSIGGDVELPTCYGDYGVFYRLFMNCSSLTTAPNLPSTEISKSANCYKSMFQGCSNLTEAPKLPATKLANGCYQSMFEYCSKLVKAPELPATTLAIHCYNRMFSSCSALTKIPNLPATTLADNCYPYMFMNCTNIELKTTKAEGSHEIEWKIPAEASAMNWNNSMFFGCTNVEIEGKAPALNTTYYQKGVLHAHSFTYDVPNDAKNTIVATCGTENCPLTDSKATLTLSATDAIYSGTTYNRASIGDTTAWTEAGLSAPPIAYYQGETSLGGAPTEVGTYTAKITEGGQTASVNFEITKADHTGLTVLMSGYTYNSTPSTPSVSAELSEGTATYYYNTTDSNDGGTEWAGVTATTLDTGTYYMYAVISESTNYNSFTTPAVSFTVTGATLGAVTDTAPTAVTYDGEQHGITPVACETSGVTIKYGTVEGTYDLSTAPSFTDAGTHTIYYQITMTGYTPKTGSVDVVINPKQVTVSGITAVNRNYDGTTSIPLNYSNVLIAGKVADDDVSVTATGTLDSANAGTGKTVTISALTLTGAKAGNYTLEGVTQQTTTTATVNQAAISLSQPTSYAPTNVDGMPVVKENTSNPLVTASTNALPDGIITEYKLEDGGVWSTSIPTATGVTAGNYKVYYRFVRDTNYSPLENAAWYVTVEVGSGSVSVTATGATSENLDDVGAANKVAGKDVTITLNVAPIGDASTVTNKSAMESKADTVFNGGASTKDYLDIHIEKAVLGEGTTQITDTSTPIEIAYSYTLSATNAYVIIRDHNGTVTAFKQLATKPTGSYVDGTYYLDVTNNIVYIYSKYFSDYMIASASGHTVIFNTNGGSAVDQMIVADGDTIASLPTTTRSGYTFNGWYSDAGLSTAFTTTTAVSGDITVYAKWTQNPSNGSSTSGSSSSEEAAPKTTTVTVNVTHTVVAGDTMSRIARKYGLTLAKLAALNPQIKNINRIYPGQLINVGTETKTVTETETKQAEIKTPSRSVTTYVVKKGDTLIKIARNNRMSLAEIAALNRNIKNLHWIYPGQVINIHK